MYRNLATIDERAVAHSRYATYSYDTDRYNRARLSYYFSVIQEAAGVHAGLRGLSIADLQEQGKTWVITRNIVEIHRYTRWGEIMSVKTWAAEPVRLHLPRYIEGYDEAGRLIFRSTTLWAILETERGRPQRPQGYSDQIVTPAADDPDHPTTITIPKPLMKDEKEELLNETEVLLTYDDFDSNLHVNNISYLTWALGALSAPFRDAYNCSKIDVSFQRQTFLGDQLLVRTWAADAAVLEASEPALFQQVIRVKDEGEEVVWEGASQWRKRERFTP